MSNATVSLELEDDQVVVDITCCGHLTVAHWARAELTPIEARALGRELIEAAGVAFQREAPYDE